MHFKNKPPPEEQQVWIWRGAILGAAIIGVLAGITGCIVGGIAISNSNNFNSYAAIVYSGPLPETPYAIYLDQAAIPLQMTLPGDLTSRVGNVYRVWSRTTQPHSIVFPTGVGTTWNGVHTKAVWSGAIGNGLVFEVIGPNRVGVVAAVGVSFE